MTDFEDVWQRVVRHAGETFRQKAGRPFTYSMVGGSVVPATTNRLLARSQFERAFARMPASGPGELQDLQGPSYLWAILVDPRVGGAGPALVEVPRTAGAGATTRAREEQARRAATTPRAPAPASVNTDDNEVSELALRDLGFLPLSIAVTRLGVMHPGGVGSEWTTIGEVPDAPGLYAFTVRSAGAEDLRVMYVGMTEHLWMVTKGRLPRGGARAGQRYGRPTHAGVTRQRINAEITRAMADGLAITHWVRPLRDAPSGREEVRTALLKQEADLIQRWQLRRLGWNRG